jgi:membrane-bound lytic murein transglycosylase D
MQVNRLSVLFFLLLSASLSFSFTSPRPDLYDKMYKDLFVDLTDAELEERIMNVTQLFEPRFTSEVKGYLRVYLTSRPEWTQTLIGRTSIYFPIFERKIEEKGLPNDVKIISVIESALRTGARSRVGAQGLWQFMPGTAKENDLVIDKNVDEREDPYRATDAALEYLTDLHKIYNDWALAIAAYNSGPGRVNQAIAISRSRNFWNLRNYLPRETRNYVPAFLAAAYMLKHYTEYYITPETPRLDFQITKALKVYDELSFQQITSITGISLDDLRFLNTSYRKDFIPANKIGFTLLLPARLAPRMEAYLSNIETSQPVVRKAEQEEPIDSNQIDQVYYSHVMYDAQAGEKLQDIAELFNVDKYNIRHWNHMSSDEISGSHPLIIHYIKNENRIAMSGKERKFVKRAKLTSLKIPAAASTVAVKHHKTLPIRSVPSAQSPSGTLLNMDNPSHYRLRRGESLQDVLRKYPSMNLEDLQMSMRVIDATSLPVVAISKS